MLEANVQRDVKNYSALMLMGWKVIVVWECHLRRVSSAKLELAEIELIQKLADAINGV